MSIVTYGATYDGTALVTTSGGQYRIVMRLVRGLYDAPEVRGSDTIIPGAAGRTVRNRVRDRRMIELAGFVAGVGATDQAQRADVDAALASLATLFSPTRSPASLVIATATGTATITARPLDMVVDDGSEPVVRHVSIELEAVGADWVFA